MLGDLGIPMWSTFFKVLQPIHFMRCTKPSTPKDGICAQDVRRQLYSMDDDRTFFDWIQKELRTVERRLEDGRAVLAHLEGALINVSCDDPGASIGQQLALPLLQERLDTRARGYAAQRAAAAEEAIIKEEVWPPLLLCCCCQPSFGISDLSIAVGLLGVHMAALLTA